MSFFFLTGAKSTSTALNKQPKNLCSEIFQNNDKAFWVKFGLVIFFFFALIFWFLMFNFKKKPLKFNKNIINKLKLKNPKILIKACMPYILKQTFTPGENKIKNLMYTEIINDESMQNIDIKFLEQTICSDDKKIKKVLNLIPENVLDECWSFSNEEIDERDTIIENAHEIQ